MATGVPPCPALLEPKVETIVKVERLILSMEPELLPLLCAYKNPSRPRHPVVN